MSAKNQQIYPLTHGQKRIWFHQIMNPDSALRNSFCQCWFDTEVDKKTLEKAIQLVIQHNDVFRIEILEERGDIHQSFREKIDYPIDFHDFRGKENDFQSFVHHMITTPLEGEFLFYFSILDFPNGKTGVFFGIHHVIGDGTSIVRVVEKIKAYYESLISDESFIPVEESYAKFIEEEKNYLDSDLYQEHKAYWHKIYPDLPGSSMAINTPESIEADEFVFTLGQELEEKIKVFCGMHEIRFFNFFVGLFSLYWSRIHQLQDFVLGTLSHGRYNDITMPMIGMFVNTLGMRINKDPGKVNSLDWIHYVGGEYRDTIKNDRYPFDTLIRELKLKNPDLKELFNVMINYQRANYPITSRRYFSFEDEYELAINIYVVGKEKKFQIKIQYQNHAYDFSKAERMFENLCMLAEQMIAFPELPASELELVAPSEKSDLLKLHTDFKSPTEQQCLHILFEDQAKKTPNNIALVFNNQSITYNELNKKSNQLAHGILQSRDIKPDDRVGLVINRSPEMIIAILGVLKAGAAYVPIDPDYPDERIKFITHDSNLKCILTDDHTCSHINELSPEIHNINLNNEGSYLGNSANPEIRVKPDNLCYIIYTSGSTGRPKGIMTEHRNVMNLVQYMIQEYKIGTDEKVLLFPEYHFDASVELMWISLLSGNELWLIDQELVKDPFRLSEFIGEKGITHLDCVPGFLKALPYPKNNQLKRVVAGGDICTPDIVRKWPVNFHNEYGPTETTITCLKYDHLDGQALKNPFPIGRPIGNTRVYILDEQLKMVPQGYVGEICIAGKGLARGYLNLPELTEKHFVPDPLNDGETIYRTGDLGRINEDLNVEFLGRKDHQLKIRGYRIESGEIEAAILNCKGVKECVVTSVEVSEENELAAYVVGASLNWEEIKGDLKKLLPDYMIPTFWIELEKIPLTSIGKVDRKKLPLPKTHSQKINKTFELPETEVEHQIAKIWRNLLKTDQVGINSNFFELGGHSMMVIKMISEVNELHQVQIPLKPFFRNPTINHLTRQLSSIDEHLDESIEKVDRTISVPLSPEQESLWFITQFNEGNAAYNINTRFDLEGDLDIDRLNAALNKVLKRQEIFATRIFQVEGRPFLKVEEFDDLKLLPEEISEEDLERILLQKSSLPFSMNKALYEFDLFQISPEHHVLFMKIHHILFDGWSMNVFMKELASCYNNTLAELPLLDFQYRDYSNWRKNTDPKKDVEFWRNYLNLEEEAFEFPTDFTRPAEKSFAGNHFEHFLPTSIHQKLIELSKQNGITLNQILLSIYLTILNRYTGKTRIRIGLPMHGRNRREFESIMGYFVNMGMLELDLESDPTFNELSQKVSEDFLEVMDHQNMPLIDLARELQVDRSPNKNLFFQVLYAYENRSELFVLEGLETRFEGIRSKHSKYDLTLTVIELDEGLKLRLEYDTDLFRIETILSLMEYFTNACYKICDSPDQPLSELELTPQSLLSQDSESKALALEASSVPMLFEEITRQYPERDALISGDKKLSYLELNQMANKIANHLHQSAIRDQVVAMILPRSINSILAILGILKSGNTYLPIDPAYPIDRIRFMLRNAGVSTVFVETETEPDYGDFICKEIDAIIADPGISDHNPGIGIDPEDLAYIMYTSGTTGEPNGVEIPHRGIIRLVRNADYFPFEEGHTYLQLSPLNFDASTFEIWGALLHGRPLVLYPERIPEPGLLGEILRKHQITVLWLTSTLFNMILDESPDTLKCLKYLLTGGEALSVHHIQKAHELLPDLQLINGYGPTENTTFTCCYTIPKDQSTNDSIPIGFPINGSTVYVVDKNMNLLPPGVPGELLMGGLGLAKGYKNNEALTKKRFISTPKIEEPLLYRSGDRVRKLPSGALEFLGRIDRQVKIRGHRIEPEEVEQKILTHPEVSKVFVTKRLLKGNDYLVGYYEGKIEGEHLKNYLESRLPNYMIPETMIRLESIPLTDNGKLDWKVLPDPEPNISENLESASTLEELKVRLIWKDILGNEDLGVEDNFFEMGGTSLQAAQAIAQVNRYLKTRLPVTLLFNYPTIRSLIRKIREEDLIKFENMILLKEGEYEPLFLFPGVGGIAHEYHYFSKYYNGNRSLYGIEYPEGSKKDLKFSSLNDYATQLTQEIIETFPDGPYYLLGFSLGGKIAYEVAVQLENMGKKVALVGIISTSAPMFQFIQNPILRRLYTEFNVFSKSGSKGLYLKRRLPYILKRSQSMQRHSKDLTGFINRLDGIYSLWGEYKSEAKLNSDILVVREKNLPSLERDFSYYFNSVYPEMGWEKFSKNVSVEELEAREHGKLLQEPEVKDIASIFEKYTGKKSREAAEVGQKVHLYKIHLQDFQNEKDHYFTLLNEPEKERASGFKKEEDRLNFILRRGILRKILAKFTSEEPNMVQIHANPENKPQLDPKYPFSFSLSKSGDYCLIAIGENIDLGIDLEMIQPDFDYDPVIRDQFTSSEQEHLGLLENETRRNEFYRIWTAKEAMIKANKVIPMNSFTVPLSNNSNVIPLNGKNWYFHSLTQDSKTSATLVVNQEDVNILESDLDL